MKFHSYGSYRKLYQSLSLRRAWIEIFRPLPRNGAGGSLSLRRAWIEIVLVPLADRVIDSRSPYGERGLKLHLLDRRAEQQSSLSLRRAWIEIIQEDYILYLDDCRSPYGERGLKFTGLHAAVRFTSRSPYGERGLKCLFRLTVQQRLRRSPYGERGLKYSQLELRRGGGESLSLRRAWIEISPCNHPTTSRSGRFPYGERGLKYRP